ncbi:MAG: TRAP transporter small permease subunit [Proteobacteria bacterium]|nr:TRAP transporter small permease subunit [Pseudomonadota bacterium]MCH8322759.1 TRAP transporter small permease subunit [Pseudomonadota bacterium]
MQKFLKIADRLDALNEALGKALGPLVIVLVLVQFALVIMSGVFHVGSIKLQESLLYINSLMFLGAAGYTLLKDAHVRVDVFYRDAPERKKAKINLAGTLFLLFPFLVFVWVIAIPYVFTSWRNLEASFETSGLPIVYILKSFILLFAFSLSIQGVSLAVRSWAAWRQKG